MFARWHYIDRKGRRGVALWRLVVARRRAVKRVRVPRIGGKEMARLLKLDATGKGGLLLMAASDDGSRGRRTEGLVVVRRDGAARVVAGPVGLPDYGVAWESVLGRGARGAVLSESGGRVAYIARHLGGGVVTETLRVVGTGSGATDVEAFGRREAPKGVGYIADLRWVGEGKVVFTAGSGRGYRDVYVYDVGCRRVRRVLGGGRKAGPFEVASPWGKRLGLDIRGMWLSRSEGVLYVRHALRVKAGSRAREAVDAVALGSGKVWRVYEQGLEPFVTYEVGTCDGGATQVRLPATDARLPATTAPLELLWWEGERPWKQKRVRIDGPMDDLLAPVPEQVAYSRGCRRAAVRYGKYVKKKGGGWVFRPRLALVPVRGGGKVGQVDLSGIEFIGDSLRFSPDGSELVFVSLKPPGVYVVAATGGKPKKIYTPKLKLPGTIWIFGVK